MAFNEEGKNVGGRPSYKPTDEQRKMVEAMSSVGIQQDNIAKVLGISKPTLEKYFREELDVADVKANAKVAANLFRQATKDDPRSVVAAIFWMKTRMGWKEPVYNVHSGNIGVEHIDKMSEDELNSFIAERTGGTSIRSGSA